MRLEMNPALTEFAPAKLNLFLHVLGRRADGYHLIESLVSFASVGDRLTFEPGAPLGLSIEGPFGGGLSVEDDNLVLKAARAFVAHLSGAKLGAFTLEKNLPIASGIGGGSADAAAALRLLARANDVALDDPRVMDAARILGADVPVCLDPAPRLMRGIGHALGSKLAARAVPALLVNPGVEVSTAAIFSALDMKPGERRAAPVADDLAATRNDLAPPAIALQPVIARVLAALEAKPGVTFVRMSGSGATCFALFESEAMRDAAAEAISPEGWWIAPCAVQLPL